MKKVVFLALVLWLLSVSMFCSRLVVTVNGSTTHDVYPGDSIQEAINLADHGDIIFVHAGTYRERVVVNKRVSLIGEDKHNTIIDWNGTGSVVYVTAGNTVIANFTLTLASRATAYPDSGIYLYRSSGNNISNNIMIGNYYGLHLVESSGNTITGNNITNNDRGIYLYDASSNNIISENNITNNGNGIYLDRSSGNIIYRNNFIDNAKHVDDSGLGPNPRRLSVNFWDDGYPSGGNYWDDYLTRYPDAKERDGSGIGDTPYVIYYKNIDNYPLLPYWFPPTVSIVSPENKTYAVANVPLIFTVSEATSWMGYSLDGQVNVTISGNTTLFGLSDGVHTITVYANDTAGNMGSSDTVYFTVDTVAPNIELLSPENKTYAVADVPLIFTVSESTSWMGYSLDGKTNNTITGDTTLRGLSDGTHSLVVYASDMLGNMGSSGTVYFTVDTTLPIVTILSPENRTYDTTVVPLLFTVDESVSWLGYSLDGQANVTITGNVTLTLSDGLHYVVVYATDTAGNMGASGMVYFSVDTEAPSILVVSPTNTTYASTSVPLRFVVYGPTSWIGYSLDGQMNVTVYGNTTLVGLSDGIHTITVYATDTAGNIGYSDTVYFTVDTMVPNIELLSPENKTYAVADVPLSFIVSEATSWMGYSLDGRMNVTVYGNTILFGLSDGVHTITVYAADVAGNMGSSGTVYFTVDTTLPVITILSPQNKTYDENDVPLSFTVDKSVSWLGYSLDGKANVTITGDTILASLLDGMHYVVVYANNTAGKMGASGMVYFTVDTEAPIIMILSPKNETYSSASFSLNFTESEPTSWIGYSLDGQMNVTVGGNTTVVGLSDGVHTITVYANDTVGNMGSSDTVTFTIDTTLPIITILSPQNRTYDTTVVPLSFTVDEAVSWMAYSLDGQANVAITGDTTLSGLSEGSHSLIVYVKDVAGNAGTPRIVYFTIETQQAEPSQLWIVAVIVIIAGVGFAFTGYMAYDLFKRART